MILDRFYRPPRVGLALSGGGARGLAHIGILKVLEREGIPIDAIAGTSMGGIVGGLYAAGKSIGEIEAEALKRGNTSQIKRQSCLDEGVDLHSAMRQG